MTDHPIDRLAVIKFSQWALDRVTFTHDELVQFTRDTDLFRFRKVFYDLTTLLPAESPHEAWLTLSPAAMFGYFQYVELKEAMAASVAAQAESERAFQQSKRANWLAMASLIVSGVLALASIILQVCNNG